MILLIFGWMVTGSAFIALGWTRQGWRRRRPASPFNAALMMSFGIDLFAVGWVLMLGGRIEQILFDGATFPTEDPVYYLGAGLVIAGKSALVWVAALGAGRSYSSKFWWSYWAALAAWAAFVTWRAIAAA